MEPADAETLVPGSRLHHVGIICRDRAQVDELMRLFGMRSVQETWVEAYQADCVFTSGEAGGIEFIIPRGGKLKKFNKGVGGLHHIAVEVQDLEATSARLRGEGIELLEATPVDAGDLLINFVPPLYTRGVIVEVVQKRPGGTS